MNSIPLTIYLFIFPQVTFLADNCQPCKSVEGSGNGKPNMKCQICQVRINVLLFKSKFDSKRNHFDFPGENTFLKNTLFYNKRNINSRNLYFIRKNKKRPLHQSKKLAEEGRKAKYYCNNCNSRSLPPQAPCPVSTPSWMAQAPCARTSAPTRRTTVSTASLCNRKLHPDFF